jgi:hypothetical protein
MFKPMLKAEFADSYYNVSRKTLVRWIERNTELKEKLSEIGYRKYNKMLTPTQMELITKLLG